MCLNLNIIDYIKGNRPLRPLDSFNPFKILRIAISHFLNEFHIYICNSNQSGQSWIQVKLL